MRNLRKLSLITSVTFTAVAFASGCAEGPGRGNSDQAETTGSLGLKLRLDASTSINTVHYEISGSGGYSNSGDIDVTDSATINKVIPQIPAGSYKVELSAKAFGGDTTCAGSSTFEIVPHTTASVTVHLQCRLPQRTGTATISGTLNVCPTIDGLTAGPDAVVVGETAALLAQASDTDHGPNPLSYHWTATSGSFSDPTALNPTFKPNQLGVATVTLTVSDGDCTDSWNVNVTGTKGAEAAPAVTFQDTPPSKSVTISPSNFSFRCNGAESCTFACSLDGGAFTACESPLSVPRVSEGVHSLAVKATATHGSEEGPVSSFEWTARRPNILTIIADDLGYSDTGPLGGEIDTPNLNALASAGRILANHHVGSVCAITRSMLISGTDHHLAGEGTMGAPSDERAGLPGYEGYLNDRSLSVAELLKDAGYHTYIAGKWHLGSRLAGSTGGGGGKTADQWGFERSFTVLGGGVGNHFVHEAANSTAFTRDGAYVRPGQPGNPSGFDADIYTDQLIEFVDSNISDEKPFFVYAAYTSPHWPLEAPEPFLSKYQGRYDNGYAPIAAARVQRQRELGLFPDSLVPSLGLPESLTRSPASPANGTSNAKYVSPLHGALDGYVDYSQGPVIKNWESLTALEKKTQARYMEIYAAMVDHLDYNVGRLIQHLKDIGEYDRTFIIFHSDNGAESWPVNAGADPKANDENYASATIFPTLGKDNGSASARNIKYGIRWAEVSATPLAQVKGFQGEGGVTAPAIVHLPGQTAALAPVHHFTHVTDDTATFLDLADVVLPSLPAPPNLDANGKDTNRGKVVYGSRYVYPVTGLSLLPALVQTTPGPVHTASFGGESYGRTYIYSANGEWKARWTEPPYGPVDGHWQLYAIKSDRGEVNDVSAQNPAVVTALVEQWQGYMTSVGGVEPRRPLGYY